MKEGPAKLNVRNPEVCAMVFKNMGDQKMIIYKTQRKDDGSTLK